MGEYTPIPEKMAGLAGGGAASAAVSEGPEFWTVGSVGPPFQQQRRSGQLWFLASETLNPLVMIQVLASSVDPRRNRVCVLLYLLAALLTLAMAPSGLDWWWLQLNRPQNPTWYSFARVELTLGMWVVPFGTPVVLYCVGLCSRSVPCACRVAQAVVLAALVVTVLKMSCGRERPPPSLQPAPEEDISNSWDPFGFQGSWGGHWPSGHTMSAWATVQTIGECSYGAGSHSYEGLVPPQGSIGRQLHLAGMALAYVYALVMAAAMATTVHWLSDMAAGLCVGCAIARAAARWPFAAARVVAAGGDGDDVIRTDVEDWHARGLASQRRIMSFSQSSGVGGSPAAAAGIAAASNKQGRSSQREKPRPKPRP